MRVRNKVKEAKQSKQAPGGDRLPDLVKVRPMTSDQSPREIDGLARKTAIASERTLQKIWDTPEEDEAWQHL